MKSINQHVIQWYKPEDNRCKPSATMQKDGVLCFGKYMQGKLKRKVKIGLLEHENAIVVERDDENGSPLPSGGRLNFPKLAGKIMRSGLELPLYFLFEEEREDLRWNGYVVPPLRKVRSAKPKHVISLAEHMWLLDAYKWLIDRAVYLYAKSTPLDERRAVAGEALLEALYVYTPVFGTLKEYLCERVKARLLENNKLYTGISQYNSISFDAPAKPNDENGSTLHELISFNPFNDLTIIEEMCDLDIFSSTCLNAKEKQTFDMLLDGHTVNEIKQKLRLTESELTLLCTGIGARWKSFFNPEAIV